MTFGLQGRNVLFVPCIHTQVVWHTLGHYAEWSKIQVITSYFTNGTIAVPASALNYPLMRFRYTEQDIPAIPLSICIPKVDSHHNNGRVVPGPSVLKTAPTVAHTAIQNRLLVCYSTEHLHCYAESNGK